jgi:hypothetical protein
VPLVLHELAHFQQAITQGVETYQRIFGPDKTLLALSLREGSADLIAELTTGRHINPEAERYGLAHEVELWSVFEADMSGSDTGDWMFVQPSNSEWPPDLGYWIGYRIAKSYYEHADDKAQAIRDILGLTEFTAFLQASQYDGRTTSTLPDAAAAEPPALLLGSFVDDYGIEYEVSEREWVQYPDARYHIARWEPDGQYLLARNDSTNPSDGGLWTRIDWVQLTGMAPYEWAFCLSAYAAPSAAAAESTRVARPETPRTGCNGHPYSRMRRQE